jgi:hypothetical protein
MQRELNLINPDRLLAFTAREYRKERLLVRRESAVNLWSRGISFKIII